MLTAALEYRAAIAARAWRTSSADRSRSLRAPMTVRIGCRTFWFFVTVLAERPSSPLPGGQPHGVMGVAGLRGHPRVELQVQVAELVHDRGLGRAADLPPAALAVAGIAEGDLAAPQPRAVPVTFRVAAAAAVFEGDAVFAAPAPGSHGGGLPLSWDYAW
jgi:hypothetical protein